VKWSLCTLYRHAAMEIQVYMFLNLTLHGGEGQLHALAAMPKGKELLFSIEQVAG